jgi:hypothetical protein
LAADFREHTEYNTARKCAEENVAGDRSGKAIGARHANIRVDKVPPQLIVGLARQSARLQGYGFDDDGSGSQKCLCLPVGR